MGSAGAFGGMLLAQLIGWLVPHSGYGTVFAIIGSMHPLAFLVIVATVPNVAPLSVNPEPDREPAHS